MESRMGLIVPKVKDDVSQDDSSHFRDNVGMTKPTGNDQIKALCLHLAELREGASYTQETMAAALSALLGFTVTRDRYSKYETRTVIPR